MTTTMMGYAGRLNLSPSGGCVQTPGWLWQAGGWMDGRYVSMRGRGQVMGVKSAESLVPRDPGGSFVIRKTRKVALPALCTV